MRKYIISVVLALLASAVMYAQKDIDLTFKPTQQNYYEQSFEYIDGDSAYNVTVHTSEYSGETLIVIKKAGQEDFTVHNRATGEFVEWTPTVKLKRVADVADVVREVIPQEDRNSLISENSLKYTFLVSMDSGEIKELFFSTYIKPGTDRALYAIPPSTIIKLGKRFMEVLEFDVKEEYKKYDYLVSGIGIRFGFNGKILINKPGAMYNYDFSEY